MPASKERDRAFQADEAALNFGFVKLEILPDNVGYLDLRSFSRAKGASESAIVAVPFLAHTDALIIDLRHNGGGNPAMLNLLCSYATSGIVSLPIACRAVVAVK